MWTWTSISICDPLPGPRGLRREGLSLGDLQEGKGEDGNTDGQWLCCAISWGGRGQRFHICQLRANQAWGRAWSCRVGRSHLAVLPAELSPAGVQLPEGGCGFGV